MYKTIIKVIGVSALVKFMRNDEDRPEIIDFYFIDPVNGPIKFNLNQESTDEVVDLVIDNITINDYENA